MDISNLIPISCTDRPKIEKLRSLIIQIQSAWLDNLFDSGLTFSNPDIFKKMQEAICLMEQRDNASAKGFDLKTIASDYDLLEKIFIASEWSADQFLLNSDDFKACDLVRIHHFSAMGILKEVQSYIAERGLNQPLSSMGINAARESLGLEPIVYPDEDTDTEIISNEINHEQA